MKAKQFEVKILKNKDPKKGHLDASIAQISINPDANGIKSKYYHVSVLAQKSMINGVMVRNQTKDITFVIFEKGNRSTVFNDIAEILAKETNYTVLNNGDILLEKSQMGASGDLISEDCGFNYYITDADGKHIIDKNTGLPRQRHTVQAFIFESEADSGLDEVIITAEINRAMKNKVETEEVKPIDE